MSESQPETIAHTPRLSQRLRTLAIATTLLTAVICGTLLWRSYSAFLEPVPAPPVTVGGSGAPLVVGVGRTPGGPGEWVAYAAAFARLQDDLGRPVTLRYVVEGSEVAALLESGEVDVALVSVDAYLGLAGGGSVTILAAPVVVGHARDAAVLVVSERSAAMKLEDLRGDGLVLTEGSLSSEGYAAWLMRDAGETIAGFFGHVEYAESQDEALNLVVNGRVAATCARRSALAAWPEGTFRVIDSSPEFGMPPIVARADLDASTVAAVRESLLGLDPSADLPPTSLLDGFAAAADADYAFSRALRTIVAEEAAAVSGGDTP